MARAKYNWFFFVKNILYRYPNKLGNSAQALIQRDGIQKAIMETEKLETGPERLKLIQLVYFKNIYTISGAANEINVSEKTAQRWSRDFIYCAAKHMGYL